ncbi:MAG: hypothetical protein JXA46_16590 [Dehalococcoidales bacterium]|nr:hypothetical protein [Dehalococcoidales bacterium]
MKGTDDRRLVLLYIYLAAGVFFLGTGITFLILCICAYYRVEIVRNLWLLAIPPISSLFINVFLIELYKKLTRN